MPEPILDPLYWKRRLERSRESGELHLSVFMCDKQRWERIEAEHRKILAEKIQPDDSVLDAGCGYGRLLTLMPPDWSGKYLGIDISPDFVQLANALHPNHQFIVGNLQETGDPTNLGFEYWRTWGSDNPIQFDWAIAISMRPMVRRNLGSEVWDLIEANLRRMAKNILFLEYDEGDPVVY